MKLAFSVLVIFNKTKTIQPFFLFVVSFWKANSMEQIQNIQITALTILLPGCCNTHLVDPKAVPDRFLHLYYMRCAQILCHLILDIVIHPKLIFI